MCEVEDDLCIITTVKCDDYLPDREGDYETDIGVLSLMIHGVNKRWYKTIVQHMKSSICTSYRVSQPKWWNKKLYT